MCRKQHDTGFLGVESFSYLNKLLTAGIFLIRNVYENFVYLLILRKYFYINILLQYTAKLWQYYPLYELRLWNIIELSEEQ